MTELAERHEIKIRGRDGTIVFTADSEDGRLVIRQVPDGEGSGDACSITLGDPDELRAFFKGLRRIVASLDHETLVIAENRHAGFERRGAIGKRQGSEVREAVIAQAREANAQAFAGGPKTVAAHVLEHDNRALGVAPAREISMPLKEQLAVDLTKLPIPLQFKLDAAPYITAGQIVARDPVSGIDTTGFHRLMLRGNNRLGTSLHSRRRLYEFRRRAESASTSTT